MALFFQAFVGSYSKETESLKFTLGNSETASWREAAGRGEFTNCLVFGFECLPDSNDSELELVRAHIESFLVKALEDKRIFRQSCHSPKVSIGYSNGVKMLTLSLLLVDHYAATASGIFESLLRTSSMELNFDSHSNGVHFLYRSEGSKNFIDLCAEVGFFENDFATMSRLYESCESTFRFKSMDHLASVPVLKKACPEGSLELLQALFRGENSLASFIEICIVAVLKDKGATNFPDVWSTFKAGIANFKSIKGFQICFNHLSYDFHVNFPDLFRLCRSKLEKFGDPLRKDDECETDPLLVPTSGTFEIRHFIGPFREIYYNLTRIWRRTQRRRRNLSRF